MYSIGAAFYARLGPTRGSSVSAMELAMVINAVTVLALAGLTLLAAAAGRGPALRGH
jgi:hypothetical protein